MIVIATFITPTLKGYLSQHNNVQWKKRRDEPVRTIKDLQLICSYFPGACFVPVSNG